MKTITTAELVYGVEIPRAYCRVEGHDSEPIFSTKDIEIRAEIMYEDQMEAVGGRDCYVESIKENVGKQIKQD